MPTREVVSYIKQRKPHVSRLRGEREAGATLPPAPGPSATPWTLCLLPRCPGGIFGPRSEGSLPTVESWEALPVPTFLEPVPMVSLGQARPRLILFDSCCSARISTRGGEAWGPQCLPDDSNVQVSTKDWSLLMQVRLPLMSGQS